jgi:hypothetical protein
MALPHGTILATPAEHGCSAMTSDARIERKRVSKQLREAGIKGADIDRNKLRLYPPKPDDVPSQLAHFAIPLDMLRHENLTDDERVQLGILRDRLRAAVIEYQKSPPVDNEDALAMMTKLLTPARDGAIAVLGQERYELMLLTCNDVHDMKQSIHEWHTQNQKLQKQLATTCAVCDTVCSKKCPCGHIAYCGRACQLQDWQRHRAAEHEAV